MYIQGSVWWRSTLILRSVTPQARSKPAAQNSIWMTQTRILEPSPAPAQGAVDRKLESAAEAGPRHAKVGCRCWSCHPHLLWLSSLDGPVSSAFPWTTFYLNQRLRVRVSRTLFPSSEGLLIYLKVRYRETERETDHPALIPEVEQPGLSTCSCGMLVSRVAAQTMLTPPELFGQKSDGFVGWLTLFSGKLIP